VLAEHEKNGKEVNIGGEPESTDGHEPHRPRHQPKRRADLSPLVGRNKEAAAIQAVPKMSAHHVPISERRARLKIARPKAGASAYVFAGNP
jgi:hypothetical protein